MLIDLHGGSLQIDSEVDRGTEVRVLIPNALGDMDDGPVRSVG